MHIVVAAVGKARQDPVARLFEHYAGRIQWPFSLKEVEVRKPLPPQQLKEREAELLLAAVPAGGVIVALDEHGSEFTSDGLAGQIRTWRDDGVPAAAFLIGGADGHGTQVLDRARLRLALGRMTWPHLLVRGMVAEQVYRAQQILAGHPYHRA